jgi:hypothetical protein
VDAPLGLWCYKTIIGPLGLILVTEAAPGCRQNPQGLGSAIGGKFALQALPHAGDSPEIAGIIPQAERSKNRAGFDRGIIGSGGCLVKKLERLGIRAELDGKTGGLQGGSRSDIRRGRVGQHFAGLESGLFIALFQLDGGKGKGGIFAVGIVGYHGYNSTVALCGSLASIGRLEAAGCE